MHMVSLTVEWSYLQSLGTNHLEENFRFGAWQFLYIYFFFLLKIFMQQMHMEYILKIEVNENT